MPKTLTAQVLTPAMIKLLIPGASGVTPGGATAAFLRHQYLPHVRGDHDELPAMFDSGSFTDAAAKELAQLDETSGKKLKGTAAKAGAPRGWVELRTRRFDGLVRQMGVPHPLPYARIVMHVEAHWNDLEPFLDSENSMIKPEMHGDGRLVQMDYETAARKISQETRLAHGREFMVKADISACFPSIYLHAIDWALRGKAAAKADKSGQTWQAQVDTFARNCHFGETTGVMIGPVMSNVLSEIVLQQVDKVLRNAGYAFTRHIDDYKAFTESRARAEDFVVDLQRALAEYNLDLNRRKTEIVDARAGTSEAWMADVTAHLPFKATAVGIARFVQTCERLSVRWPTGSVLKFGVKTVLGRREDQDSTSMIVVDELVRLCAFHPHLVPVLASELEKLKPALRLEDKKRLGTELNRQMVNAARRLETDVVLWLLYMIRTVLRRPLNATTVGHLLNMNDDLVFVGIAALSTTAHRMKVASAVNNLGYVSTDDWDRHWLCRYELWRVGLLTDADLHQTEKPWMDILLKHGVSFSTLV